MTEATLPEMTDALIAYVSESRTRDEMVEMLSRRFGVLPEVAGSVVVRAAGKGLISIAPGTSAKRWTTTARARALSRQAEDGE